MKENRPSDVLLWGATGFTGELVAAYLLRHEGVGKKVRWSLGGRNLAKLQEVRKRLADIDPAALELPLVVADAKDGAALHALCQQFAVVCSTVGPYAKYGSPLVAACAATGTHYCDLTGEVHWMRQMIDAHDAQAAESGARIVHACGFDSIPSDLGAVMAWRALQTTTGLPPSHVTTYVRDVKGGFSGGTVGSMVEMMEQQRDPTIRKIIFDTYTLLPAGHGRGPQVRDLQGVIKDSVENVWTAPFLMAPTNAKLVRRSFALLFGEVAARCAYEEKMGFKPNLGGLVMAVGFTAGLAAMGGSMSVGWLRNLLVPLLPQPGEGPDEAARNSGRFRYEVVARNAQGQARVRVDGDQDPGYGSTAGMLAESALSLAFDAPPQAGLAGFLTPSTAMGDALLARLPRAGVTFALK